VSEIDLSGLDKLAPEARRRVAESLKQTLEVELARASAGIVGPEAMAHSRSKGFFFSRSKTSDALRDIVTNPADRFLVEKVESLDDAAFAKFADRVATLRKIAREE
jgi:hypothetical protein